MVVTSYPCHLHPSRSPIEDAITNRSETTRRPTILPDSLGRFLEGSEASIQEYIVSVTSEVLDALVNVPGGELQRSTASKPLPFDYELTF